MKFVLKSLFVVCFFCCFVLSTVVAKPVLQKKSVEERLEELEKNEYVRSKKESKSITHKKSTEAIKLGDSEDEESSLSWGAYGEIKYVDQQSDYKKDKTDVHRFVLLAEYDFSPDLTLEAEIEYEHAGFEEKSVGGTSVNSSEVFVEQAILNYSFSDAFEIQGGLNLVPMGIINLAHEPTTFLGISRPRSESKIIPSTWREVGLMFHGKLWESLTYRVGIVNGSRAKKFNESSWIRGGRTKGSKARAEDFAGVISLDYSLIDGLTFGSGYYVGNSGQGEIEEVNWKTRFADPLDLWTGEPGLETAYKEIRDNKNKKGKARVHILESHITFNHGPWMAKALFVKGWMSEEDARNVNRTTGKNIGKDVEGAYFEIGYNVLKFFTTHRKLYPFMRVEYVNTQKHTVERHLGGKEDVMDLVCASLNNTCFSTSALARTNRDLGVIESSDPSKELYGIVGVPDRVNDQRIITLGMAFFPEDNVVIKLEYERQSSRSNFHNDIESRNSSNNKIDRIGMGIGFTF